VREAAGHAVARDALAATPPAPPIGLGDPTGQHRTIRLEVLPDDLQAEIVQAAPQYPVGQLARMDRALLRCAIGEVLHSPTPARVAIAEWVELARSYSGDPMRRLMNGVLGRIARSVGR